MGVVQTFRLETEESSRKSLGDNISKLVTGRDMKNTNTAKGNLITRKMKINFYMFCTLMMNLVGERFRAETLS